MLSIPSFIAPNLWAKGAQNLAPRDEESSVYVTETAQ